MLGWVVKDGKNFYSRDQVYESLCEEPNKTRILCSKISQIPDHDHAKKYLFKVEVLVYQYVVVLSVLIVIGAIMLIINSDDEDSANGLFDTFETIKAVVSVVACFALIHFGSFVSYLPRMKNLQVMNKFNLVQLAIIFTEVQPMIIGFIADWGLIANLSLVDSSVLSLYTNSLLVVSEMIIVGFLLIFVFPLTDFDTPPSLRESLVTRVQE